MAGSAGKRLSPERLRVIGAFVFAALLHTVGILVIDGYGSLFALRSMLILTSLLAIASVTFGASAVFAAIAGVLLLGFTGSAYGDVGQPYLFETIAAVVIGGTALVGGRGSYLGTIGGALVLTELNTLLIGIGLQAAAVQTALGIVIVALVSFYGREPHVRATI
jgi:ribose transport system permease protein